MKSRDRYLCVRCGARGSAWHHRRSRSVVDEHQHCTCNGIWLCGTCHEWVHHNPFLARVAGWIVSREKNPYDVVVKTLTGDLMLDHDGGFTFAGPVWQRPHREEPRDPPIPF